MSLTDETLVYEVGLSDMLSPALSSFFGLRKLCQPTNPEQYQPIRKTGFVLEIYSSHRSLLRHFERSEFTTTFERLRIVHTE
jgi:hypothetical protein